MKTLFTLDSRDYTAGMPVMEKHCVRGIIFKNGRLAVQQNKMGEYKLLGGMNEPGEDHMETLAREIREEAGLLIRPESVKEIGLTVELRRDIFTQDKIYKCVTYFYACDIDERVHMPLKLTESEKENGFVCVWETPEHIREVNEGLHMEAWKRRDTEFIKLLIDGKVRL